MRVTIKFELTTLLNVKRERGTLTIAYSAGLKYQRNPLLSADFFHRFSFSSMVARLK